MTSYRRASDRPQTVQSVFGGIVIVGAFALKFRQCALTDWALIVLIAFGLGVVFRALAIDALRIWRGQAPTP